MKYVIPRENSFPLAKAAVDSEDLSRRDESRNVLPHVYILARYPPDTSPHTSLTMTSFKLQMLVCLILASVNLQVIEAKLQQQQHQVTYVQDTSPCHNSTVAGKFSMSPHIVMLI
jgi:hypothetical protein